MLLLSGVTIGEAVILISDKAVVSFGLTNNKLYTSVKERMFHFGQTIFRRIKD
jgi:hypothetical protein